MAAFNPCKRELLTRLALADGWVARPALTAGMGWTEARVDDELADLVMAELAHFNPRGHLYRLAGTPLARKALCRLAASGEKRVLLGMQDPKNKALYRLALARRAQDAQGDELLVMAELEIPYPNTPTALVALSERVSQWLD